jgi:hypothetical protein
LLCKHRYTYAGEISGWVRVFEYLASS